MLNCFGMVPKSVVDISKIRILEYKKMTLQKKNIKEVSPLR